MIISNKHILKLKLCFPFQKVELKLKNFLKSKYSFTYAIQNPETKDLIICVTKTKKIKKRSHSKILIYNLSTSKVIKEFQL